MDTDEIVVRMVTAERTPEHLDFSGIRRTRRSQVEIKTMHDLRAALRKHTGPWDRPGLTAGISDLTTHLMEGRTLRQFTFVFNKPAILKQPIPEKRMVVGVRTLATLLNISHRHTYRAVACGLVNVMLSDWKKRKSGPYRYVVLDDKAAWWVLSHAAYHPLADLATPWFTHDDIRQAAFHGHIVWRHGDQPLHLGDFHDPGEVQVFTNILWLRWACRQRDPDELAKIKKHQVIK